MKKDFVSVPLREWVRELYSCLEEHFSADELAGNTDNPAANLMEAYVEWAAKFYAGESVPMAYDLAHYYVDGEFIRRDDCDVPDREWERICKDNKCLVWNDKYACVHDNYSNC